MAGLTRIRGSCQQRSCCNFKSPCKFNPPLFICCSHLPRSPQPRQRRLPIGLRARKRYSNLRKRDASANNCGKAGHTEFCQRPATRQDTQNSVRDRDQRPGIRGRDMRHLGRIRTLIANPARDNKQAGFAVRLNALKPTRPDALGAKKVCSAICR